MINNTKEERIAVIDVLKGVAACLVVLGHIVTGKEEYRWLYNLIYSFHMPLFMFLAGCTTVISYRNIRGGVTYLTKRFVNIIVPYLVWTVCLSLIDCLVFGSVNWYEVWTKTFITNRMYWFLPTLYGLIVGYVSYCRIKKRIWNMGKWQEINERAKTCINFVSCIFVTGVFVLLMIVTKYQLFRDIVGFVIPFFAAVMYMELRWVYTLFHHSAELIIAFVIYILLIGRFDFDRVCVTTSILRMILGMCAVVILLQLFEYMKMPEWVWRLCVFYGQGSFLIYILHSRILGYSGLLKLQGFGTLGNLIWYCALTIVTGGVCGVFAKCLSNVSVARVLFLGKLTHRSAN